MTDPTLASGQGHPPGRWRPVAEVTPPHALRHLDGRQPDGYVLRVLIGPTHRFGASYFQLFLQDADGGLSHQPVIVGLHNRGPLPSHNWIEVIQYNNSLSFGGTPGAGTLRLQGTPTEVALFQALADVIPPGGHLMVEYEGAAWRSTAQALSRGVPPAITPLGNLLRRLGCGDGFKDWYFSEGGSEGPRKLQGYKAPSQEFARQKEREMAWQALAFISRQATGPAPSMDAILGEARAFLAQVSTDDAALAQGIRAALTDRPSR